MTLRLTHSISPAARARPGPARVEGRTSSRAHHYTGGAVVLTFAAELYVDVRTDSIGASCSASVLIVIIIFRFMRKCAGSQKT